MKSTNAGQLSLEHALATVLELALETRASEDPVVLALRAALAALAQDKAHQTMEAAHEQLEDALNAVRAELAARAVAAEVKLQELMAAKKAVS